MLFAPRCRGTPSCKVAFRVWGAFVSQSVLLLQSHYVKAPQVFPQSVADQSGAVRARPTCGFVNLSEKVGAENYLDRLHNLQYSPQATL